MFKIFVYFSNGCWRFDEPKLDVYEEPFVSGASELITKNVKRLGINTIGNKYVPITFSTEPFDGYNVKLTCIKKLDGDFFLEEMFGDEISIHLNNTEGMAKTSRPTSAWYVDEDGDECWLCPVQLKFFGEVADLIYARIGE